MNRRHFIKKSSLASGLLLVPGFLKPLERFTFSPGQKKLVVIQLSGGNDWLNTVVPYKNDVYHRARPRLALKETQIIPLEKDLALNASLGALKEFYDQGEMTIVNNVGYPNPDRSHFRSMDIWQSASSSSQILHTGWLGRYLDNNCTGSFEAIETDDFLSLALRGKKLNGMAVKNIQQLQKETNTAYFRDLINATKGEILTEDNQGYLYKTLIETQSGINYLYEKNKVATNTATYPDTELGKLLKNIAGLIANETDTKVYYVSQTGFDTHAGQFEKQNQLLNQYAEAVAAFVRNLKDLNKWDNTLVFTFSEFGRRVEENASQGTDHGTAGNVILFGKNLEKKGIVNPGPNLENLDDGDLKFTVDFRSIYKDILQNWLSADADKIIPANVNPFRVI